MLAFICVFSVRGGYYTTLRYGVIRDIFGVFVCTRSLSLVIFAVHFS